MPSGPTTRASTTPAEQMISCLWGEDQVGGATTAGHRPGSGGMGAVETEIPLWPRSRARRTPKAGTDSPGGIRGSEHPAHANNLKPNRSPSTSHGKIVLTWVGFCAGLAAVMAIPTYAATRRLLPVAALFGVLLVFGLAMGEVTALQWNRSPDETDEQSQKRLSRGVRLASTASLFFVIASMTARALEAPALVSVGLFLPAVPIIVYIQIQKRKIVD